MKTPVLLLALAAAAVALPALASSHREAPGVLGSPQVDGTDFYMFRSYEAGREGFVTLIANYNPLQDAYGGPNYFPLDPQAFYDIHITNDADALEDITFRFRFSNALRGVEIPVNGQNVAVPLSNVGGVDGGQGNLNILRSYTVRMVRGNQTDFLLDAQTGSPRFGMPFDNIGAKSFADYAGYAHLFVHDVSIPGCQTPGRVFVGQRREGFQVNLGEIFDLVNLNPVGPVDGESSDTADKNVTSLALEVPINCLTGGGDGVIGGWTSARLARHRMLADEPTYEAPSQQTGDYVQVSRLGMPLVNEVVIGLPDKNRFNASHPSHDAQFAAYITNPTLPELLQILFGVEAPNLFPRADLVQVFATGVPGLNADGSFGEMQRLNTAIDPVPASLQDPLGVLGGDLAGFPNGRRPGDDVVDAALRVVMGVLLDPADAPAGLLPYTDGAYQDAHDFAEAFPYLRTPIGGSPN